MKVKQRTASPLLYMTIFMPEKPRLFEIGIGKECRILLVFPLQNDYAPGTESGRSDDHACAASAFCARNSHDPAAAEHSGKALLRNAAEVCDRPFYHPSFRIS